MSEPNVNAIPVARQSRTNVKALTSIAMLTAISYAVMVLSKMIPPLLGFLQLDLKDTVITIGGFVFGPMAAALISVIVAAVEFFTVSHTGPIGLIMNVLATCAFCCTAAYVYKKKHTHKGAVLGLSLGTVILTIVMLLWNYLITPFYQGVPREVVAGMLPTVFLPFNVVKGGLNMALILVIYKPVVTALRKIHMLPASTSSAPTDTADAKKASKTYLVFSLALLVVFVALALVLMMKK